MHYGYCTIWNIFQSFKNRFIPRGWHLRYVTFKLFIKPHVCLSSTISRYKDIMRNISVWLKQNLNNGQNTEPPTERSIKSVLHTRKAFNCIFLYRKLPLISPSPHTRGGARNSPTQGLRSPTGGLSMGFRGMLPPREISIIWKSKMAFLSFSAPNTVIATTDKPQHLL